MKLCAYILAAGLGSRLRPITESVPKPLVEIQGKRCVDYVVEKLIRCGFHDIFINCFYLKDEIKKHISETWPSVRIIEENHLSGTGGALRANAELKNFDITLIHNGDVLSGADLYGLVDKLRMSNLDALLLCGSVPRSRYLCFFRGLLCGWGNDKARTYARFVSINKLHFLGIHAVKTSCLKYFLEEEKECFSIFDIYLKPELKVGYLVDDKSFWVDIGTMDDLEKARSRSNLMRDLGLV